jgi:hypothetical protein
MGATASHGPAAGLIERLEDLLLVDLGVLVSRLEGEEARALVVAHVAVLEEALSEARALLREGHRELATGVDPLALLALPSVRRAGNASAVTEAAARLGHRAEARRELSRLEELTRVLLPHLLEADRKLSGM